MTSGTNHSGSGIGHDLIYKERNVVKTWSQHGTLLVNSSFEHKYYHRQIPALKAPSSNLDCAQPHGRHAGAPKLLVTTM